MPSLRSKPKRLRRNLKRRLWTIIRDGDLTEDQISTLVDNFVEEFYELLDGRIQKYTRQITDLRNRIAKADRKAQEYTCEYCGTTVRVPKKFHPNPAATGLDCPWCGGRLIPDKEDQ